MKTLENLNTELSELLAQNKIKEAIEAAQKLVKSSALFDQLITQSGRYTGLMKDIHLGTIDYEKASTEKNKIRYALTDIIRAIEEGGEEDPEVKKAVDTYLNGETGSVNISGKNILKDVKTGNIGGDFIVGDNNKTTNQNAEKNLQYR